MDSMNENIDSFIRMNLFSNLDTGNQFLNMMLSTILMMYIPSLFSKLKDISRVLTSNHDFLYFFRYNSITLEGIRTISLGGWQTRTQNIFSVRFRAMWHHIQKITSKSIYSVKEYPSSENRRDAYDETDNDEYNQMDNDIFVVDQMPSFKLSENIWCQVKFTQSEIEGSSTGKCSAKLETISLKIYSKKYNTEKLEEYINKITQDYIDTIYNKRKNELFIYSLLSFKNFRDEGLIPQWDECKFTSTRNFNTIFFDKKEELISKIDFFNNNKEWYEKEGHPYTLGIALHGPPGTGKTSVIKCIANKLERHLVVIPLSKVKTQQQFYQCFFETGYNHKNAKYNIGFDKKIIVLEDIDCMSDIIMQRKNTIEELKKKNATGEDGNVSKNDLLEAITKGMKNDNDYGFLKLPDENSDDLTLSFLLNIIDGIRETPGRILIITSNFYNQIDTAFKRPGRIDISLEMKNASIQTIETVVNHYYNKSIDPAVLSKLKDDVISPAKLVNLHFNCNSYDEYISRILKHCSNDL